MIIRQVEHGSGVTMGAYMENIDVFSFALWNRKNGILHLFYNLSEYKTEEVRIALNQLAEDQEFPYYIDQDWIIYDHNAGRSSIFMNGTAIKISKDEPSKHGKQMLFKQRGLHE